MTTVTRFLQSIVDSLQSTQQQRIILGIVFSLLFFVSIVVLLVQRYSRISATRKSAEQTFRETLRNVEMTPRQMEILETMSTYGGMTKEKKYLLVQDAAAFSKVAEELLRRGLIEVDELRTLRNKLDVCCFKRNKNFTTTKELPEGLHLYVTKYTPEGYHGLLVQRKYSFFAVKLKEVPKDIEQGETLGLFFKRGKETYRIHNTVKVMKKNVLYFPHTEAVEKAQKRNYYRRQMILPAALQRQGYNTEEYHTQLADLGGGGAKALNPAPERFRVDDSVVLHFKVPTGETFEVRGDIVRISEIKGKKYLHIRFLTLDDKLRDKIVGIVLSGKDRSEKIKGEGPKKTPSKGGTQSSPR